MVAWFTNGIMYLRVFPNQEEAQTFVQTYSLQPSKYLMMSCDEWESMKVEVIRGDLKSAFVMGRCPYCQAKTEPTKSTKCSSCKKRLYTRLVKEEVYD